jgi:hypothetical protein
VAAGVTFPVMEAVDVNGPYASPLFHYLKRKLKGPSGIFIDGSFEKFVIDPAGKLIARLQARSELRLIETAVLCVQTACLYGGCVCVCLAVSGTIVKSLSMYRHSCALTRTRGARLARMAARASSCNSTTPAVTHHSGEKRATSRLTQSALGLCLSPET